MVPLSPLHGLTGSYRSGRDDLGRDFFEPLLRACTRYRRAASFFSSSALRAWAGALPNLVRPREPGAEATIQLLAAPVLGEADLATLRGVETNADRLSTLARLADGVLEDALLMTNETGDADRPRRLMAYLIASGRMELRFAFARHVDGADLYHPKFGVFDLPGGHRVGFTGSANETAGGHGRNYESIDVYRSWVDGDAERVGDKAELFDITWRGREPGVEVLPLTEEALTRVRAWSEKHPPDPGTTPPVIPPDDGLWDHQREAVGEFLKAKRGILEMATGTGKTRTALHLCRHLAAGGDIESIIVSTYGTDLLDQWSRELGPLADDLGYSFGRRYGGRDDSHYFVSRPRKRILLCARGQLAPVLRGMPADARSKLLLIHDEVHKLGSEGNRRELDGAVDDVTWQLGLSATPDREYDAEGNAFVARHIGDVIYRFGLEDAIRRGILAPFDYVPVEWRQSEDDRERVKAVFKLQAARESEGRPLTQEQVWTRLAAVYKSSPTKLPHLRDLLDGRPGLLDRSIVFIADKRYAEDVTPLVFGQTKRFHTYFEGDDKEHLGRFSRGELGCLIACHRLSEGIDVRSIRTVVLLSADRARLETIQRIGRCLRQRGLIRRRPQRRMRRNVRCRRYRSSLRLAQRLAAGRGAGTAQAAVGVVDAWAVARRAAWGGDVRRTGRGVDGPAAGAPACGPTAADGVAVLALAERRGLDADGDRRAA